MGVELTFGPGDFEGKVAEAKRLMAKAKMGASAVFEKFIQGARDLLGDRPKLQQAIQVWGEAGGQVKNAGVKVYETKGGLDYWTGDTATAVRTWLNDVRTQNIPFWTTTLGGSGGASGAVVNSLQGASDAVCQFLNGLYEALVHLVTGLLDAIGTGISGFLKEAIDPGAIVAAGVKAVNTFATTCQKLFSVAVTTMSAMDKAGNDIWIAGKVLPEVAAPSGAVSDLGMKPNVSVG